MEEIFANRQLSPKNAYIYLITRLHRFMESKLFKPKPTPNPNNSLSITSQTGGDVNFGGTIKL